MRKTAILILAVLLLSALYGCGAPAESPNPSEIPSITILPTQESTPEPTPDSSRSLTTGLPSDKEYKPITVMIENSPQSRPQTGLQEADIIYEAMAEGGITRMICVFNDNKPVVAGPVRSTRLYFINIQKEWDSPLVHFGGPSDSDKPSYVYGSSTSYIKVRVDGIKGKYNDYFWRDKSRSAPNNAYTNVAKIQDKLYDYTPAEREPFKFDEAVSHTGQTVDTVGIPFLSGKPTHTEFKYDSSTGLFTRYVSGKEFEVRTVAQDENGKQTTSTAPMTVQNLIVQYAKTYTIKGDRKGRRMVDMVGSGDCEYYIGGVQLTGTWERKSLDDSTKYYLADGSEVVLKPGNTWIAVQPTSDKTTVTFQ